MAPCSLVPQARFGDFAGEFIRRISCTIVCVQTGKIKNFIVDRYKDVGKPGPVMTYLRKFAADIIHSGICGYLVFHLTKELKNRKIIVIPNDISKGAYIALYISMTLIWHAMQLGYISLGKRPEGQEIPGNKIRHYAWKAITKLEEGLHQVDAFYTASIKALYRLCNSDTEIETMSELNRRKMTKINFTFFEVLRSAIVEQCIDSFNFEVPMRLGNKAVRAFGYQIPPLKLMDSVTLAQYVAGASLRVMMVYEAKLQRDFQQDPVAGAGAGAGQ